MKKLLISFLSITTLTLMSFTSDSGKYISNKSHIKFFSSTPVEDIEANNYKAISTINVESGEVVFSVPMQSFEFEKALMQEHFNQKNFLHTKKYPKAQLKGHIVNLKSIDFTKDGTYDGAFKGEMTIRGESKPIEAKGTLVVEGETITLTSDFDLTLADYGIAFKKGKPSTNIAKTIQVSVLSEYVQQ